MGIWHPGITDENTGGRAVTAATYTEAASAGHPAGTIILVLDSSDDPSHPEGGERLYAVGQDGNLEAVAWDGQETGDVVSVKTGPVITVAPDETSRQPDDWPTVGAAGIAEALESVANLYPRLSATVTIELRPGVFSLNAPLGDKLVPTIRYVIRSTEQAGTFPGITDFSSATDTQPIGRALNTVIESGKNTLFYMNGGNLELQNIWIRGSSRTAYLIWGLRHSTVRLHNCAVTNTSAAHVRADEGSIVTVSGDFAAAAAGAYTFMLDGSAVRRVSSGTSAAIVAGGQYAILGTDGAIIDWPSSLQTRWTSRMAVEGRRGTTIFVGNLFCRNQSSDYAGGAVRVSNGSSAVLSYARLDYGTSYLLDALYGSTIRAGSLYAIGTYSPGRTVRAYGGSYIKVPSWTSRTIQFSPRPNTFGNGGAYIHQ